MLNIPTINGPDKIFFGTRKDDNSSIYITKPKFDCNWYWSFGYLGNCHYHLYSYQTKQICLTDKDGKFHMFTEKRNINMYDALQADYDLAPAIANNLWQFCELALTIYTLKEMAELCHIGGAHMTINPGKAYLQDKDIYNKLVTEFIPKQCQALWDLIQDS
jgi:hypothetical protein